MKKVTIKVSEEVLDSEELLQKLFDEIENKFGKFDKENIKQRGLVFTFYLT